MDGKNLLLSFLYANDGEKVDGSIKLMKQIFLIQKKSATLKPYNFVAFDLGPVSFEIHKDMGILGMNGLVKEEKRRNRSIFSLTARGTFLAKNIFEGLSGTERKEILDVKKEFNFKHKDAIVLYVYQNFPEFTHRSKYNSYWR